MHFHHNSASLPPNWALVYPTAACGNSDAPNPHRSEEEAQE